MAGRLAPRGRSPQTRRRVLAGESVPADEKLVSISEPETAIIRKGKLGHAVEFGRVVWLAEVEGGIVSQYMVLPGNPFDAGQLVPTLEQHRQQFGKVPVDRSRVHNSQTQCR